LIDNPKLADRIGQDMSDQFWLTGSMKGKDGMTLTHNPDTGFFSFTTGDGERIVVPPKTSVETDVQKNIMSREISNEKLDALQAGAKRSFLEIGGRMKSVLGKGADRVGWGGTEWSEYAADRSAWINQTLEDVMKYRKEITGVAGGPAEMKKIEGMRANPNMGPDEFARNIEEIIETARREQNTSRRVAGYDEVQYEPFEWEWENEEAAVQIAPGVTVRKL
jgi:hypothetical protein